jgi:hypothetical protein
MTPVRPVFVRRAAPCAQTDIFTVQLTHNADVTLSAQGRLAVEGHAGRYPQAVLSKRGTCMARLRLCSD